MTTASALEFEVGLSVIQSYRRLSYLPWYALAEFVDNSTQSFIDNENALRSVAKSDDRPLVVQIDYDREADYLSIRDNAMGMSFEELERAMHLAQPPPSTTGRSKYGMGLKTAATWLGDLWEIKTKKLGSSREYTVHVDVERIATGNARLEVIQQDGLAAEDHYTRIEIRKLNRKLQGRTLGKIGDYLSSMYREDFRQNRLTLIWRNETLDWKSIEDELLTDREGRRYQSNFDFTIESVDEREQPITKNVCGWAGVLKDGSRAKAGFSILHSGRVIKGWPDAWRPESLYGQIQGSNDLINQRLIGEIHLDDFDVSHTKDDILWLDDEENLVQEKLREKCFGLREVARTYRKRQDDERGPTEVAVRSAVDRLKQELNSPEMADLILSNPMLPESVVREVVDAVRSSVIDSNVPETFGAVIGDIQVKGYVDEMSVNDPYLTIDTALASEIVIIINASHPHWSYLKGADGVLNYLRHCTYDGIAESQARDRSARSARINPNTVKLLKDRLLRIPFEIEQNSAEDSLSPVDEDEASL